VDQVKVPIRDVSNGIMQNDTTKFIENNELKDKFHSRLQVSA
jgi:hypothetical protein